MESEIVSSGQVLSSKIFQKIPTFFRYNIGIMLVKVN